MSEEFRVINEFPDYEINREGIVRRISDGFEPKVQCRENKPTCGEYYCITTPSGNQVERTIKRLLRDAFTEEPAGVDLDFIGYPNYRALESGDIWSHKTKRILKTVPQQTGYRQITLCSDDGKRENNLVHRLIALAFHPNPENLPQVNHINGRKYDNRVVNLEWVSVSENAQHAIRTGLRKIYYQDNRKYSNDQIHRVCKLIGQSYRNFEIEKLTDVDRQTVSDIRYGSRYTDISNEYDLRAKYPSRRRVNTEDLIIICMMLEKGKTYSEIKEKINVSTSYISNVKNRKAGLYISKDYSW